MILLLVSTIVLLMAGGFSLHLRRPGVAVLLGAVAAVGVYYLLPWIAGGGS
jgi:hypothetical protein